MQRSKHERLNMAADHHNGNGASPHQGPGIKVLEGLAREYEEQAAAIRRTIAILGIHQSIKKRAGIPSTIDHALALEEARRLHRKRPGSPRPPHREGYGSNARKATRRAATAAALARFDEKEPRTLEALGLGRIGIGPLILNGYLKKKGQRGYIRTAKPFDVEAPARDA